MRYWWVNQNQTYRAEVGGGYVWSPKRNRNGARNQFYENMREVAPGDLIFSFSDTRIPAIGLARSYCYPAPRPEEFGHVGQNWDEAGWRVDVDYVELSTPISPKAHIEAIRPLLPPKYSPLRPDGNGLQGVYLAEVGADLGQLLQSLITSAGNEFAPRPNDTAKGEDRRQQVVSEVEDHIESEIQATPTIDSTEKQQIIKARVGQGRFRENVQRFEHCCRVSRVADPRFLIASHIKPWRASDNQERLDGENGLMLSPNIDFLFDRGFISFMGGGELLISPVADKETLHCMGVRESLNSGRFTTNQMKYLTFHRREVFLEAGREA